MSLTNPRNSIQNYLALSIVLLICACSNPKRDLVKKEFIYTADELSPYIKDNKLVRTKLAKSGNYVFQVNKEIEFSLTYCSKLYDLDSNLIKNITIGTWIFCKDAIEGNFTVEINSESKSLLYKAVKLQEKIKTLNKWEYLSVEVSLDKLVLQNPNNELKVYLWNNAKREILMDDFEIKIN